MNPFSDVNSVLVFNNAKIYHNQKLLKYLDTFEVKVEFLPSYSSDLNSIESAFATIKKFLQRNRYFVDVYYNPTYPLIVAYTQITFQIAEGYFRGSGYF